MAHSEKIQLCEPQCWPIDASEASGVRVTGALPTYATSSPIIIVKFTARSITAKAIAGSRIDSTAPRSGRNCHCATFARFSEPGDFRVFQHNPPWAVVHSITAHSANQVSAHARRKFSACRTRSLRSRNIGPPLTPQPAQFSRLRLAACRSSLSSRCTTSADPMRDGKLRAKSSAIEGVWPSIITRQSDEADRLLAARSNCWPPLPILGTLGRLKFFGHRGADVSRSSSRED